MVTRNLSPAPSQSDDVMIGVGTYTNPSFWKKEWILPASTDRTRETAEIVLVRGRK